MVTVARRRATAIGFIAVLLWSLLAVMTVASGRVPPFQLAAMTFAVGALAGVLSMLRRGVGFAVLSQPWPVWALGVGGLFGYHALYFAALRLAPPAEAGLICYLWPLLIVVLSAFLPGERLRIHHVVGAVMGFAGTALLFAGRGGLQASAAAVPGYVAAFVAAFVWAGYSVLSRRFRDTPSDAVTGFCAATAILSALCHLAFETTVVPSGAMQWLAIAALGLGPVGIAFYVWDVGMKHGDIRLLGVSSYAAPVLSTLCLIAAGYAEATWLIALSAVLIATGGLIASRKTRA